MSEIYVQIPLSDCGVGMWSKTPCFRTQSGSLRRVSISVSPDNFF